MTFDVAEYTRSPFDLRPDAFDLEAMPPATGMELDTMAYLWRCEHAILDLMRDVLVTPTHAESRVTAFLVTWGYEQYWLAETLHEILARNGRTPRESTDTLTGRLRRAWDDRLRTMGTSLRTNLLGESIVAGHMVTGWLDSATLALCYRRLADLNRRWHDLVAAVDAMKQRHLDFYADQLRERSAQAGTGPHMQSALRSWRWPGTRYSGHAAIHPVAEYLLSDPSCRGEVQRLDGAISALTKVGPVTPVRRALGRFVHGGHASARFRVQ